MKKLFAMTALAAIALTGAALADPIEGKWKTQSGATAQISPCGGSFCVKLTTGQHAGKQIGKMTPNGSGKYKGSLTDPADDKTYSGSGSLNGNVLKMRGCVLAVLCKTQTWTRLR